MTTKFLSSPVSSFAARVVARPTVSAFLFWGGSAAANEAAAGRSAPRQQTCPARAAGAPAPAGRRPSAPRRPWPASRRGRASRRPGPSAPPFFTCSSAPAGEALAHPPQHAGEVRVVKRDHLRAVAPPRGPRQILPLCSCEVVRGEAQPQVAVHVRAFVLLGLHGVEELLELCHVSVGNLRLHPAVRQVREARVADHVARVARDHEAAGVPLVRGQGQLRREALRLHQRLVVDHDELALVRPAVPLQEDPRALVAQQPQLRAAVGGRAVVGHLQLAPARPVLQEEIVREVGGVGHGERVGREELRRGDRARARHVAAHHAACRHSAARGREGAVQALAVQRARGGRPADCQRGARQRSGGSEACRGCCARDRQRASGHVAHRGEVPGVGRVVDGQCAARDSCGGAQQAHAGRAGDAQRAARHGAGGRQRGSGDGACGCERCAGDCARGVHARGEHVSAVHIVAQQLVAAHVALCGEPVQRGRAREGQVRHGDRLSLEG